MLVAALFSSKNIQPNQYSLIGEFTAFLCFVSLLCKLIILGGLGLLPLDKSKTFVILS